MDLVTRWLKKYVRIKECPRRESVANGSVGSVRLMVRGGCRSVIESGRMKWKYQDDLCGCGQMVREEHAIYIYKSKNDGEE